MTRTDEADWTERGEQNELETDSRLASAAARLEELLRREAPLAGHLYIVGTPLGNLGDMTPRALGILAGILDVAIDDRRLASNPARNVRNLPRHGPGKRRIYLTHDQVATLAENT